MTDTNQPAVPPPPPAGPPVAAPATRSTGKFVAGLIMTIIGGLWTLLGLANVALAAAAFADDPGYAMGRLVGGLFLPIAVLVVGIVLLRSSKPKAQ
jgi:hypothetical protein